MSKKRKSYTPEFKTKVVLELLKEEDTAATIASRYGITVQTLNQWKKKFLENATLAFDIGEATKEYRQKIEKLEKENEALAKTLGKTTIERDWAVGKLKSLDSSIKKGLVDSKLNNLSMTRQCRLLGLNRSGLYYRPRGVSEHDLKLMRRIDAIYTERSTMGYRRIHARLKEEGWRVGHNKVHRLMQTMGIAAIYPRRKRNTTQTKSMKSTPTPLSPSETTKAKSLSIAPTRSGAGISLTSPSRGASCTWPPSSTGTPKLSWLGDFQTPWIPTWSPAF